MTCSDCRFSKYFKQLGAEGFFCRIDPPKNTLLPPPPPSEMNPRPMPSLVSIFPQVDEHGWCGHYEPDPKVVRPQ